VNLFGEEVEVNIDWGDVSIYFTWSAHVTTKMQSTKKAASGDTTGFVVTKYLLTWSNPNQNNTVLEQWTEWMSVLEKHSAELEDMGSC